MTGQEKDCSLGGTENDEMDVRKFALHFADVLAAKDYATEGEYCQCVDPDTLGTMCRRCKRLDRIIEIEQVVHIVRAHEFEPDQQHPEMCYVCTNWETHPRHHGVSNFGRLRDGTIIDPPSPENVEEKT